MLDPANLIVGALGGLGGALLTIWLNRIAADEKRWRDLADNAVRGLTPRQNFEAPPMAGPSRAELERLVDLAPLLKRRGLRQAVATYLRTSDDWDNDNEYGQPVLRNPKEAEDAHRALIKLLQ